MRRYQPPAPHLLSSRRWNNKRIGILGGSFNPPHSGHMHIALSALRKHKFHAIWWLVSPQNPLKTRKNNFSMRFLRTKSFVQHPKMVICDIESRLGTQYSLQTVKKLQKHFPKTKFTWIAGMDNASIFHRWDGWRQLLKNIPFLFFSRPPAGMAVTRHAIHNYRGKKNVRYILTGKTRNISSTIIRQKRFAVFSKIPV